VHEERPDPGKEVADVLEAGVNKTLNWRIKQRPHHSWVELRARAGPAMKTFKARQSLGMKP
jgi:hypothetical protein